MWGSVASAVAGDHATVKSIVTSAVDDPHSFEATPADAAAITDASLVVYNGGGYDHWVDDVLAGHPGVTTVERLLTAARARAQPANEHVFYDPATAKAVAVQIADQLAKADAAHADAYRANAAEFGKQADEIAARRARDRPAHPGARWWRPNPSRTTCWSTPASPTRPRRASASAVEEDTDPSPADLAAMLDLINTHQVSALVYNPQTADRGHQADPGRRAARLRSDRQGDRDPPEGHRLPDLAAPDRSSSWRASWITPPQTNR